LFYVSNTLHPALRMMFYPDKYAGDDAAAQVQLREAMQGNLLRAFATLDAALGDFRWRSTLRLACAGVRFIPKTMTAPGSI